MAWETDQVSTVSGLVVLVTHFHHHGAQTGNREFERAYQRHIVQLRCVRARCGVVRDQPHFRDVAHAEVLANNRDLVAGADRTAVRHDPVDPRCCTAMASVTAESGSKGREGERMEMGRERFGVSYEGSDM